MGTGAVSRLVKGLDGTLTIIVSVVYIGIMLYIWFRFNSDGSTIVRTLSYWGLIASLLITARIVMVFHGRITVLEDIGVRALIVVPIYFFIVATQRQG